MTQAQKGDSEARRWALNTRYGATATRATIAGHVARTYELGPEVPPGDIDGRSPAVVVWHDGDMFYLVASRELRVEALVLVAESMYPDHRPKRRR